MYITGSNGVITIQFLTQQLVIEKADIVLEPLLKYEEPLKNELVYFTECLLNKCKPVPDEIDGARAIAVAEAIIKSIQTNKSVELEIRKIK